MLDERYGEGVSSLSPLFAGSLLPPTAAQCPVPSPLDNGPLFYAHSFVVSKRRATPHPQSSNRPRAVAPEDPLRERPGAEPVRRTPLLLNNSSQSLGPIPLRPLLNSWCAVAQRTIDHRGTIEDPGITLALIKSRGRKKGAGDFT